MPPSASSNLPRRSVDRVGEGAPHVAEQLALEQRLGQRRAVHPDERSVATGAREVDLLGEQLLARAALAQQQHRRVGRGRLAGDLELFLQLTALPDQLVPRPPVGTSRSRRRASSSLTRW